MQNTTHLVNTETGELTNHLQPQKEVIQDTENFTIYKLPSGKFEKVMKYKKYYSHVPEKREEIAELFKVLNSSDDNDVIPMKNKVGQEFEIHQVYMNPYESFNEETGENDNGVTTTIFTGEEYIATSSKSVYYTVLNMFQVFGYPSDKEYEPVKVKPYERRMTNGNQINLELV